ncbi:craniofacial development protein 2-like [Teleopsis dalmanni]|uniref:craniofacial development protein 2-like n=1 Tax=Teleopsis dalmanni TaxID=139649 RepID=UPI0018CD67BD|nr:craniofacial development protein 2-like [Teleopsis dalmanni]
MERMLQPGKMAEIADELRTYDTTVACLLEVRWKGHDEIKKRDYSIFYSGAEIQTRNCVMALEPLNERIRYLRLKGKFQNISILSVYAPTEESEDENKDEFYDKMANVCSKISRYDIKILYGDYNAKIGKEQSIIQQIAGKYSLHENTNGYGLRLCNFVEYQGLFKSSTSF